MSDSPPLPSHREAAILEALRPGERYGLEIRRAVSALTRSSMPLGSLYTTLARMEDKRLITSRLAAEGQRGGGNRRRFYRLTGLGSNALDAYVSRVATVHRLSGQPGVAQ